MNPLYYALDSRKATLALWQWTRAKDRNAEVFFWLLFRKYIGTP